MKYQFIEANRSIFEVGKMCHVLDVSRSGYYSWCNRKPNLCQEEDKQLKVEISQIHTHSRKKYGSPKITQSLRKKGRKVGHNRVVRLMRELNIKSHRKGRKVCTTQSNHKQPIAENLLNRNFWTSQPNVAWVRDITYCATKEGWFYVCVILDLYSRKVIGWSMRSDLKAELVLDSFKMACLARRQEQEVIFHSDRGVQYACGAFIHKVYTYPSIAQK